MTALAPNLLKSSSRRVNYYRENFVSTSSCACSAHQNHAMDHLSLSVYPLHDHHETRNTPMLFSFDRATNVGAFRLLFFEHADVVSSSSDLPLLMIIWAIYIYDYCLEQISIDRSGARRRSDMEAASPAMERSEAGKVVTRKCKRTVVGAVPVQPGRFHRLSVLDRAMEYSISIRAVFYYPRFPSAASSSCTGAGMSSTTGFSTTARLTASLSEVLGSYPAATGRLQRAAAAELGRGGAGSWLVKCNDAGVRMVEARARGSVEEWLLAGKLDRQREMELLFWEDLYEQRPYFWSTFYVQLTEFEGGGLAIGVSCSHMLADATCLTMLVKAWADVHLLGKILSPPDFHPLLPPRGSFTPADDPRRRPLLISPIIDHYKSAAAAADQSSSSTEDVDHSAAASSKPQQRFNTAAFAFSDETVRSIVDDACSPAGGAAPTAFQALAALFWASISRAKAGSRRRQGLVDMSVCVDARGALGLSKSFFGNAMVFSGVAGGGGVEEEGRLDVAARAIADAMSSLEEEEGGVRGLLEWLEEAHEETGSGPTKMRLCGPALLFANWEGLGPYAATFEPGIRPVRVSYYLEPVVGEGQVVVLPLARGHAGSLGRVVMVTLPDEQLKTLCGDARILGYQPEMLMDRPE